MENVVFGAYKSSKSEKVDNDFIPIVALDKSRQLIGCTLKANSKTRYSDLSVHIDESLRKQELVQLIFRDEYFILTFTVKKGNSNANDTKGNIRVKSSTLKFLKDNSQDTSNAKNTITLNKEYNSTFSLRIYAKGLSPKVEHYIEFYADDDDYYFYSVENVYCGRIVLTYIEPLFPKISQNYPRPYSPGPCSEKWENQCAIRVSLALVGAGIPLHNVINHTNPKGPTYCKHGHVLGAYNLMKHIDLLNFWEKRLLINGIKEDAFQKVNGKRGLLYFEGYPNEIGERRQEHRHIEIWDGYSLVSKYDYQMFQSNLIIFWEVY